MERDRPVRTILVREVLGVCSSGCSEVLAKFRQNMSRSPLRGQALTSTT
ncbi:hypothetical protein EBESD8_58350 [Rhodococcus aetherivorans]|nr:hypothetical protein EBESD8_58350 [Rhodococcus aetherivorans]